VTLKALVAKGEAAGQTRSSSCGGIATEYRVAPIDHVGGPSSSRRKGLVEFLAQSSRNGVMSEGKVTVQVARPDQQCRMPIP